MMSKLKILLPVLLLVGGGAYKFVLAKPKVKEPVPKVHGEVYVLPKDFLVNLSDGRFGKLNVALVFDHGFTAAPAAGAAVKPWSKTMATLSLPKRPSARLTRKSLGRT